MFHVRDNQTITQNFNVAAADMSEYHNVGHFEEEVEGLNGWN